MLRKILIPLDASKYTPIAVRVASQIANGVQAEAGRDIVKLSGLGIVDLDQLPTGRFASMVPRDEIVAKAREEVESFMEEFQEIAVGEQVPEENLETHYMEGSPFSIIMHEHIFSDLVVIGEECSFLPNNRDYITLENIFHWSSRPILITREAPLTIDKIVLAMDGTASSSRMLYSFLHINPFPKAKVVLTISAQEEEAHDLGNFFDRMSQFITSYGFDVEKKRLSGDLLEELPALVTKEKAGAVAMGVHNEHFIERIRKPMHIGGSAVEALLEKTNALLFTAH